MFDVDTIKLASKGREIELFEYVAHLPRGVLDGKHHPCPKCGGTNRFRCDTRKGFCICNQCFSQKNGDILAAIMHFRGIDFPTALAETAYRLGITAKMNGNGKHDSQEQDPLARLAEVKRCPIESLKAYGATGNPAKRSVSFPMYRVGFPSGEPERCSAFTIWPFSDDPKFSKGLNEKGKPAGMFLPHNESGQVLFPEPGDTWVFAEGCKDASVLQSLGFNTIGLPGKIIKTEWLPMFQGVEPVLCFDNDPPGKKAVPDAVAKLKTVAMNRAVRVVHLPAPDDVRDNIAAVGVDAVRAAVEGAGEGSQEDESPPWPTEEYDAEQLASIVFNQNYLVEEVIVEGQPGISGGGSKVCKTSVVGCDLALSCAAGVPFLNRFNVPEPLRVGVVSAESGMATLQETMLRIAKAKELDLAALKENLFVTPEPPNLCSDEGISSVVEWCKRRQMRLVILDPAYLVFPELAECSASVYAVGEVLRRFSSAVLAENITPIVIHHTIKSPLNRFAPMELMDLSGSGWCEFARQWILLSRRGQYIDGSGRHELHLRIGGSAGHSSLWHLDIEEGEFQPGAKRHWRTNLIQSSLARKEQKQEAEEAAEREIEDKAAMIVKHLEQLPGKADTETGIFKQGIGRTKAAQAAFQMLIEDGRIAYGENCVTKGGRKTGREGFQLVNQEDNPNEDD